jgi:hypothetical protein
MKISQRMTKVSTIIQSWTGALTKPFSTAKALKNVSQHLVTDLEAALSQSETFELNENMHAVLYSISAQTSQDDNNIPWEADAVDFITFFSQINIDRNTRIQKVAIARWAEEATTKGIVAAVSTRDMPTPHRYP